MVPPVRRVTDLAPRGKILEVPEFRPGARERKKQATRERIEAAALHLFADRGFDATTVDEIAAQAEVSPRTFFRYFATKDDVLFGGRDAQLEALDKAVGDRPTGESEQAVVCNALVTFSEFLQDHGGAYLVRRRLTERNPSLLGSELVEQRRWEQLLARSLAQQSGRSEPSFEQRVLAGSGVAALAVAVHEWYQSDGEAALPALTRIAVTTLTN
jgi:AcrR family transcriptional regulator